MLEQISNSSTFFSWGQRSINFSNSAGIALIKPGVGGEAPKERVSATGLAIIIAVVRNRQTLSLDEMDLMKH